MSIGERYAAEMRRSNLARRDAIVERFNQFLDSLNADFTGKVAFEFGILRGTLGQHTFTVTERGDKEI